MSGRPLFDRAAIAAFELTSRRPRTVVVGGAVLLALGGLALPVDGGRAGEVLARSTYRLVVDELGVELVEGHAADIERAAAESDVSATLLAAIVYAESRGRGGQTSHAGALGLGQLTPAAARDAARRLGLPEPSPEAVRDDDVLNLRLAAAHLRWLVDHSEGWPLEKLLVSYNAGRVRMFRWLERAGGWEAWVAEQDARLERGEETPGSLTYARGVLAIRERFRERGAIRD